MIKKKKITYKKSNTSIKNTTNCMYYFMNLYEGSPPPMIFAPIFLLLCNNLGAPLNPLLSIVLL